MSAARDWSFHDEDEDEDGAGQSEDELLPVPPAVKHLVLSQAPELLLVPRLPRLMREVSDAA